MEKNETQSAPMHCKRQVDDKSLTMTSSFTAEME